jgi:hypothetical protein
VARRAAHRAVRPELEDEASAPAGILDGARERLKMLGALHGMLGTV